MFRLLSILILVTPVLLLSAQDGGEFHEFTDKKGVKISAVLLDVSEDNRMMKIRREDGQEFETEINVLSLDDQQFIKSWMKTRTVTSDFRLDLMVSKKAGKTERHRGSSDSYSFDQRFSSYEIMVRNLSRETLPSSRIQYVVVWSDALEVYKNLEGEWSYSSSDADERAPVKMAGEIELPSIPFNREEVATTEEYEINQMFLVGDLYGQDEFYGIIARVVGPGGGVLAETRVGSAEIDDMDWDEAMALDDPRKRN